MSLSGRGRRRHEVSHRRWGRRPVVRPSNDVQNWVVGVPPDPSPILFTRSSLSICFSKLLRQIWLVKNVLFIVADGKTGACSCFSLEFFYAILGYGPYRKNVMPFSLAFSWRWKVEKYCFPCIFLKVGHANEPKMQLILHFLEDRKWKNETKCIAVRFVAFVFPLIFHFLFLKFKFNLC